MLSDQKTPPITAQQEQKKKHHSLPKKELIERFKDTDVTITVFPKTDL